MAFPALTRAINLTTGDPVPYPSIMDTLFEVDTFDPPLAQLFSIALSRDVSAAGNGGTLTIGGVPDFTDPTVNVSSDASTSAALQFVTSFSATDYSFYSIIIDGYVLGESIVGAQTQIIIDSGADAIEAPTDIANAVNNLWTAVNDDGTLPCDAGFTEPFGIAIGGATYYVNPADLISNENGVCNSLVSPGDGDQFLVGDPFLKNVLAIYDWGDAVMS
jgi:hypothetical protein